MRDGDVRDRARDWLLERRLGGAASAGFGLADACVRVSAAGAALLRPIEVVVRPFFGEACTGPPGVDLRLREEALPDWLLEAFDAGPRILTQQVWWPEEGRMLRWWGRRLQLDAGCHAVLVLDRRTLCAVWRGEGMALVVGPEPAMVGQLVLKDILRAAVWPGTVNLHAAAVEHRGRAIAIAGETGSGKTTLSLCACAAAGAGYLAGERTLLWSHPGGLRVSGWPTRVRVAEGSLRRPELLDGGLAHRLRDRGATREKGKFVVPVDELARAGIPVRGDRLPLAACVFPHLAGAGAAGELERLDRRQAAACLAAVSVGWPEDDWPHWCGWFTDDRGNPSAAEVLHRLASSVPCYRLTLDRDAAWPLGRWLERLTA